MKILKNKNIWLSAIGGTALLTVGCETVVRENVISSIDTGFGATVMENKQTQVPEIKVGYIRSQFYSVPTGKLVKNTNTNSALVTSTNGATVNAQISNAANITPNMVAGIRTEGGFQSLIFGLKISENFAIGDIAVNSDAATAMYIAEAKSTNSAIAASNAIQAKNKQTYEDVGLKSLNDPDRKNDVNKLNDLLELPLNNTYKVAGKDFSGNQAKAYAQALAYEKGSTLKTIARNGGTDLKDIINNLITATK